MTPPTLAEEVTVEEGDGRVTVAGSWTYEWGASRRPFLHPVTTPAGHLLSRERFDVERRVIGA